MLKTKSLPQTILNVLQDKGTEAPFSGSYNDFGGVGTYLCRQCGLALFRSKDKFHSGCGWPSFEETVLENVTERPDSDDRRMEIVCSRCGGHLGHVFKGEGFTDNNIRHCVNSLSLDFVKDTTVLDTEEAIYAGGCFWGVEYYLQKVPGVLKTEVGYTGGDIKDPTYERVCEGNTGHYEALRVIYDPNIVDYTALTKLFLEIHDPTQKNGQGPDIGTQYLSAIFYYNEEQKSIGLNLLNELTAKGLSVYTKILPVQEFYPAEDYHQDYYQKTHKTPYCHKYTKRFG